MRRLSILPAFVAEEFIVTNMTSSLRMRSASAAPSLVRRATAPSNASFALAWQPLVAVALALGTICVALALTSSPMGLDDAGFDCVSLRLSRVISTRTSLTYVHVAVVLGLCATLMRTKTTNAVALFVTCALACHTVALVLARTAAGACAVSFAVPGTSVLTQAFLVLAVCATDTTSADSGRASTGPRGSLVILLQFAAALHICLFPAASVSAAALSSTGDATSCAPCSLVGYSSFTFPATVGDVDGAAPSNAAATRFFAHLAPPYSPDTVLAAALMALLAFALHGLLHMRDVLGSGVVLSFLWWVGTTHCCAVVAVTSRVCFAALALALIIRGPAIVATELLPIISSLSAAASASPAMRVIVSVVSRLCEPWFKSTPSPVMSPRSPRTATSLLPLLSTSSLGAYAPARGASASFPLPRRNGGTSPSLAALLNLGAELGAAAADAADSVPPPIGNTHQLQLLQAHQRQLAALMAELQRRAGEAKASTGARGRGVHAFVDECVEVPEEEEEEEESDGEVEENEVVGNEYGRSRTAAGVEASV